MRSLCRYSECMMPPPPQVPNVMEFADWVGRTKQKPIYVTGAAGGSQVLLVSWGLQSCRCQHQAEARLRDRWLEGVAQLREVWGSGAAALGLEEWRSRPWCEATRPELARHGVRGCALPSKPCALPRRPRWPLPSKPRVLPRRPQAPPSGRCRCSTTCTSAASCTPSARGSSTAWRCAYCSNLYCCCTAPPALYLPQGGRRRSLPACTVRRCHNVVLGLGSAASGDAIAPHSAL